MVNNRELTRGRNGRLMPCFAAFTNMTEFFNKAHRRIACFLRSSGLEILPDLGSKLGLHHIPHPRIRQEVFHTKERRI